MSSDIYSNRNSVSISISMHIIIINFNIGLLVGISLTNTRGGTGNFQHVAESICKLLGRRL